MSCLLIKESWEHIENDPKCGRNINPNHRKLIENRGLAYEWTAYNVDTLDQIFTFRVSTYSKSGQLAACVWVHSPKGTVSGSAVTRGHGYSKREAVLTCALDSCGIDFDFEREGLGFQSLERLAKRVAPEAKIFIHQTNI